VRSCHASRQLAEAIGSGALNATAPFGHGSVNDGSPSVDAPLQARENVGVVAARGRMLSSVRPLMRQEDSRRPVWEFADRVQITQSVLEGIGCHRHRRNRVSPLRGFVA
jgi:hypothetical protein